MGGVSIEGAGILEFGTNVVLAESVQIVNENRMSFGDCVRVGYQTTLMDTDYHYIIDTRERTIRRNTAPVVIGSGTWISSTCKIMKNTHLPPDSVVGGGSLVNRDYSSESACQIFVGTPAKPVKNNRRRIFNVKVEAEINRYFRTHPEAEKHTVDFSEDLDTLCLSNFFRDERSMLFTAVPAAGTGAPSGSAETPSGGEPKIASDARNKSENRLRKQ